MRLILRTQTLQAKIEGVRSITEDPNDYAVVVDGPRIGRIFRIAHGPSEGKWTWALNIAPFKGGRADTLEEAKQEIEVWYRATR